MKITSYVSFLYCLCLMLASPTVQASEVRTAIFEGKPCINPPHVVGNYPATPFLFYIPTSGERPIKWHAENLPKGLKLDKETGIIKGKVVEKGTYKVMLKAENALGTDTQELLINIGVVADSSDGVEQLEYIRTSPDRGATVANCRCNGRKRNA